MTREQSSVYAGVRRPRAPVGATVLVAAGSCPGELFLHVVHVGGDVGFRDDDHAGIDVLEGLALRCSEEVLDGEPTHLVGLLDEAERDGPICDSSKGILDVVESAEDNLAL